MSYELFLEPEVHAIRDKLPGNMRQRVRRAISALADNPRPPKSRPLDVSEMNVSPKIAVYRLRIEGWRMVYALNDTERWVRIMGIYRRPPYDYDNLPDIVARLS